MIHAIRAARAAAPEGEGEAAGRLEYQWQRDELPEAIRELVLDDQRLRNDICCIVTAHNKALRATDTGIAAVEADVRAPETILTDPELVRVIDFGRPVAVLFVAIMHFIEKDEDPDGIIRASMDPMPSGSHMVLSIGTTRGVSEQQRAAVGSVYENATSPA